METITSLTELNESYKKNINLLDESQKLPVFTDAPKVLIKAPAGSGKTLSLIDAVATYRYEHVNDRICAITYTRAARAEMESRLQQMGVMDVAVSTIHVWCRAELDRLGRKYDFKPAILQEKDIKDILHTICQQYLREHIRLRAINEGILYNYIMGGKNMDIPDKYKLTYNAIDERYIVFKRMNHLYDFTDFPLYLYDVLNQYNEVCDDVDALFVDEFQDIDNYQMEIFNRTPAAKKFYIGDPWQSIYQFRGADGEVFNEIPDDFEKYKLKCNYRSYQEIIDYASTVYPFLHEGNCVSDLMLTEPSKIRCIRGYGGRIVVFDKYGEGCAIANEDMYNLNRSDMAEEFDEFMQKMPMILCRTNKQVKFVQELGYFNVSTVHQAKGLEYPNVLYIDTIMQDDADPNVAYVALTRAQDGLMVINWAQFQYAYERWSKGLTSNLI